MKKFSCMIMCLMLLITMSITSFAAHDNLLTDSLKQKGMTGDNVKSMHQMGFELPEIEAMSVEQIKEYLGDSFGKVARQPRASLITVTGVPDEFLGGNATEQYLSDSGMVAGTWSANGGATKKAQIEKFVMQVLRAPSAKKFYYLYGEYDSAAGVTVNNKRTCRGKEKRGTISFITG